ncbi:MAG: ribosome maturation factor RimP [Gammaproteobacteria bacterium]|nr:ribosome maturation factor RimP [Gammaproteobacteria bacterium]
MVRQAAPKLRQLIQPVVEGLGYEFVGAEFLPQGRHSLLRIYIDKTETGISVDDCERVSRQISGVFDVEDPIAGQYALEISSPGLDRPLFKVEDFALFIGEEVSVKLSVAQQGRKNFKGIVRGLENDVIALEVDGKVHHIVFDDIDQARLVPKF